MCDWLKNPVVCLDKPNAEWLCLHFDITSPISSSFLWSLPSPDLEKLPACLTPQWRQFSPLAGQFSWKDMVDSLLEYSLKDFILAVSCLPNLYRVQKVRVLHLLFWSFPLLVGRACITIVISLKKQTGDFAAVFMPSIHPLKELHKSLRAKRPNAHGCLKQMDSFVYEVGLGSTIHVCGPELDTEKEYQHK